jgi:Autotransporter beta-domain
MGSQLCRQYATMHKKACRSVSAIGFLERCDDKFTLGLHLIYARAGGRYMGSGVNNRYALDRRPLWLIVGGLLSIVLSVVGPAVANAQFACSTNGNTETCSNSGVSGSFALATAVQNATIINHGTVNGSLDDFASAGGNTSVINAGTVSQFVQVSTNGGGSASANNSGTIGQFLQVFTNNGGNASATNSGTIAQSLQVLTQTGGTASATNSGTVGQFMQAFTNGGGNATGINSGVVGQYLQVYTNAGGNASATNSGAIGQYLQAFTGPGGGNASAANSGSVGSFMQAFANGAGNATAINSGSVRLFLQAFTNGGGSASGINYGSVGQAFQVGTTAGGDASATNSGSVGQAFQVNTNAGGNASATNLGTVGQALQVLASSGGNASAKNSGSVFGGVQLSAFGGGSSSLTNSGLISSMSGGPAIQFLGGPDTLTNMLGARVIGAIDLVGIHDTVNFVGGGNWLYTFNTLAGATINTNGAPFVVSGSTVAVLDQTAFALADRSLMFFTGGVSQMLRDRLYATTPVGGGSAVMSFAAPDGSGVAEQAQTAFNGVPSVAMAYASDPHPILGKSSTAVPYYDTTVWASGFGGQRDQNQMGQVLQAIDTAYGAAVGIDRVFASNVRLGGFLGGGAGRQAVESNIQTINTTYFYGGMYGQFDKGAQFVDFALWGGGLNNGTTRSIANNAAPTGLESATANYGGWFVSPELIYGVHIPMGRVVWTPRATFRYVGGMLDGYSEAGSSQNLTVGSRAINDIEERLEIEVSDVRPVSFGGTVKAALSAGVLGLERLGNPNINTVLLGQNLSFVTPGAENAFGPIAGATIQYFPTGYMSVYINAEGTVMTDKSKSGALTGGARVVF